MIILCHEVAPADGSIFFIDVRVEQEQTSYGC
jgi:hypothetical protein